VHNLSPGLVLTGLLLDGASPAARRFFNALAEEPETVAAALAPRMRAVQARAARFPRHPMLCPSQRIAAVSERVCGCCPLRR
jgi:chlorophyll(ide) b reductase